MGMLLQYTMYKCVLWGYDAVTFNVLVGQVFAQKIDTKVVVEWLQ